MSNKKIPTDKSRRSKLIQFPAIVWMTRYNKEKPLYKIIPVTFIRHNNRLKNKQLVKEFLQNPEKIDLIFTALLKIQSKSMDQIYNYVAVNSKGRKKISVVKDLLSGL